jgi:hypothetical protein
MQSFAGRPSPHHDNFVIHGGHSCRADGADDKIGNVNELPVAGRAVVAVRLATSRVQKRGGGW